MIWISANERVTVMQVAYRVGDWEGLRREGGCGFLMSDGKEPSADKN